MQLVRDTIPAFVSRTIAATNGTTMAGLRSSSELLRIMLRQTDVPTIRIALPRVLKRRDSTRGTAGYHRRMPVARNADINAEDAS